MSDSFPGGGFFEGLMSELLSMMEASGPLNIDMVTQISTSLASGGQPVENVDPLERARLEELAAVVRPYLESASGLVVPGPFTLACQTRVQWSQSALADWRPWLELTAATMTNADRPSGSESTVPDLADSAEMLARLSRVAAPAMVALQIGAVLGHLARRALGSGYLMMPRPKAAMAVVPSNLLAFADDWSLPVDETRVWCILREAATVTALSQPGVHQAMSHAIEELCRMAQSGAVGGQWEELANSGDPEAVRAFLDDPSALLQAARTPAQERQAQVVNAMAAAVTGYCDYLVTQVGARLIGSFSLIEEAFRRRQADEEQEEHLVEVLFGVGPARSRVDPGAHFIGGVLERGGEEALSWLWQGAWALPTPSEIEAPGLWMERIKLHPKR